MQTFYLRQFRSCVIVFLSIVVSRDPEGGVIAGHRKLSSLFLNDEVGQVFLCWKLVTKTKSVIKQTKADDHPAIGPFLAERYCHLVIVIADRFLLSPYRLPAGIMRRIFCIGDRKIVQQ